MTASAMPNQPDTAVTVARSADQVSTLLQGEAVILNVKSGKYYNLNPVGSRIWDLIEQPQTIISIIDAITTEYEVERQRCEADVERILQSMQSAGLVVISTGGASPRAETG